MRLPKLEAIAFFVGMSTCMAILKPLLRINVQIDVSWKPAFGLGVTNSSNSGSLRCQLVIVPVPWKQPKLLSSHATLAVACHSGQHEIENKHGDYRFLQAVNENPIFPLTEPDNMDRALSGTIQIRFFLDRTQVDKSGGGVCWARARFGLVFSRFQKPLAEEGETAWIDGN